MKKTYKIFGEEYVFGLAAGYYHSKGSLVTAKDLLSYAVSHAKWHVKESIGNAGGVYTPEEIRAEIFSIFDSFIDDFTPVVLWWVDDDHDYMQTVKKSDKKFDDENEWRQVIVDKETKKIIRDRYLNPRRPETFYNNTWSRLGK